MRALRLSLLCLPIVLGAGCMISEQIGEMPRDLTFYFDTTFNRALVFGRAGALGVVVLWVFAKFKRPTALMVGLPILAFAGWTVVQDYPSLKGYRVEVRKDALYLNIPPEPEREFPWESILEMEIEGVNWAGAGRGPHQTVGPDGKVRQTKYAWSELPQWETMKIVTEDDSYLVRLDRLSVEQRQTLWRSIAKRGHLVEQ